MENKLKRFLILLATLVMAVSLMTVSAFATAAEAPVCYEHGDVNGDGVTEVGDAIYTLYHCVYGDDYPVNQDCDFTGDGNVNLDDALYLLWASMGDFFENSEYTLQGTIHNYYDPVWQWNAAGDEATVTFNCGCGQANETFTKDNGLTMSVNTVAAASCTKAGITECEAEVTFKNAQYISEKTHQVAATGHSMSGDVTCTQGASCSVCGHTQDAPGHVMVLKSTTAATCTASAVQHWGCSVCEETADVILEGTTDHIWKYREDQDVEKDGCVFVKTYACTSCGAVKEGEAESDTYVKHTLSAKLTQEATCTQTGVKTYSCSECDYTKTETVPTNDSHSWDAGVEADGTILYTCCGCGAPKTAVSANNGQAVDKAALESAKELQLDNDTAIVMDEDTKAGIPENAQVAVSVTTVDVANTALTEEQKEQVGDNTVYNFNMEVNGQPVSQFEGKVTVSLPYTLQDGDDIESIDVWYISDNGTLERMTATYSNGFVTFTTDHFSYYTVTRLTTAERCERYGHIEISRHKDPTCTEDGYDMTLCQRCGGELTKTVYEMTRHNYEVTTNEATCTVAGTTVQKCTACQHTVTGNLPATGHSLQLDESESKEASCTAAGKKVYVCACGYTLEEVLPQLAHTYEPVETKAADCVSGGYVKGKCACGAEEISSQTAALGHSYQADSAQWTWNANRSEATVTLTCGHDDSHTLVLSAVITENVRSASCEAAGSVTYTATASHNKVTFTDSITETIAANGHKPNAQWETNGSVHYHICSVCEQRVAAEDHSWGTGVVTKAPTCDAAGKETVACTVCGYTTENSVPATREHNFVNKICTVCGYEDGSCDHLRKTRVPVDISGYDICGESWLDRVVCDCGEVSYLEYSLGCEDFEDTEPEMIITLEDGTEVIGWKIECPECDLSFVRAWGTMDVPAECIQYEVFYEWLYYGDTLIAQAKDYGELYRYHPMDMENAQLVHLSDYGLCGMDVYVGKCYCGEASTYQFADDWACEWEWNEDDDSETCAVCGALWTQDYNENYDDHEAGACYYTYGNVNNFYLNGEKVYTIASSGKVYWHEYNVISCEMEGESCEDGVMITNACVKCGKEDKDYILDHYGLIDERVDLSDAGMCNDYAWIYSCPCGQYHDGFVSSTEDNYCQWNWVGGDRYTDVWECETCGTVRTVRHSIADKDANCWGLIQITRTYVNADGKQVFEYLETYEGDFHENTQQTYEALGDDCEENGVRVTTTCADCDQVIHVYIEHSHIGQTVKTYDLSSLGMCSTQAREMECPCGKDQWLSISDDNAFCEFDWVGSDETGYIQRCTKCQATMHVSSQTIGKVDACHEKRLYTYTISHGDATPVVIQMEEINAAHDRCIYSMELLNGAQDCTGGFTTNRTCLTCGAVDENIYGVEYEHYDYCVARESIYDGDDICGKLEKVTYACACGEVYNTSETWRDGNCNFQYDHYDGNQNMDVSVCQTCGLEWHQRMTFAPVEGETCRETYTRESIYVKDGVELFRLSSSGYGYSHSNIYTYTLLGETCDDGYTVSYRCADCGETGDYYGTYTGCDTRTVERTLLYNGDDICGPVYFYREACACGKQSNVHIEDDCSWCEVGWDEEERASIDECVNCQTQRTWIATSQQRIPGTCQVTATLNITYKRDGQVLFTLTPQITEKHHIGVADLELLEGAQSCEDGFYFKDIHCIYCGYKENWDNEIRNEHGLYTLNVVDLTQYGMCGYIRVLGCACGEVKSWDIENECVRTNTEYDETYGMQVGTCLDCGTKFGYDEDATERTDPCRYTAEFTLNIFNGDEVVKTITLPVENEDHNYMVTSWELKNPEGNCTDGVVVQLKCENCSATSTQETTGHRSFCTQNVDMTQYGGCEGYVKVYKCACGEYGYTDNMMTCEFSGTYHTEVIDGVEHTIHQFECDNCDMERIDDEVATPTGEGCELKVLCVRSYYMNHEKLAEFDEIWYTDEHDYVYVYGLTNPDGNCDDGVSADVSCKNCDFTYHYDHYTNGHHHMNQLDEYDLTQYGANCGGAVLKHLRCPCGENECYNLYVGNCELEQKSVENWIENLLHEVGQYTADGHRWYESRSYTFTCAVTDPDCDLSIRMSEYWLKEGCEAVEYQTWQLGYNPADGTFQKEVTVATGERHGYHDYTYSGDYETLEDGTEVSTDRYECPDCGSTYVRVDYYVDGNQAKITWDAINKLDNGECKERHFVRENGFVYGDFRYETFERTEYIEADGSLWWEQYVTEYDKENVCIGNRTYTNSDGTDHSYQTTTHREEYKNEWIEAPTCTQFGLRHYWDECRFCGEITWEQYNDVDPISHDWYLDDGLGTHVCAICGLENTNGASGTIVVEDLSDDDSYIIGYWNRSEYDFTPYVYVVMEGIQEDNERALVDVTYSYWTKENNGINALVINSAEAHAAAEAVMAEVGYTGNYAIRVIFVPDDGMNTLDYAITFDSRTAA